MSKEVFKGVKDQEENERSNRKQRQHKKDHEGGSHHERHHNKSRQEYGPQRSQEEHQGKRGPMQLPTELMEWENMPEQHNQASGNTEQWRYGESLKLKQVQTLRCLQASKQMLFGVYENVISQLEELQSRELGPGKGLTRSEIEMPDQSWKTRKDIEGILETQLLLFETQMKYCPERVCEEAREPLIQTILGWMARRTDNKIPHSDVDKYAAQLVEILKRGQTKHPDEFRHMPDISEKDLKGAFEGLMHGNTKKAALDREYQDNPDKQATLSRIQIGQNISDGAERVVRVRKDMESEMEQYAFSNR